MTKNSTVVIFKWDGTEECATLLRACMGDAFVAENDDGEILIGNRDGRVVAYLGDWILHDGEGFYPVTPLPANWREIAAKRVALARGEI